MVHLNAEYVWEFLIVDHDSPGSIPGLLGLVGQDPSYHSPHMVHLRQHMDMVILISRLSQPINIETLLEDCVPLELMGIWLCN